MQHLNALYQTALPLTRNQADAAEVVREVCDCAPELFGSAGSGDDGRLELFKLLIERIHRRRRWERMTKAFSRAGEPSAKHRVAIALSRVPADLREVVLLVDCQGFNYKQAAEILKLSTDAVAESLVLGRNHLQAALESIHAMDAAGNLASLVHE